MVVALYCVSFVVLVGAATAVLLFGGQGGLHRWRAAVAASAVVLALGNGLAVVRASVDPGARPTVPEAAAAVLGAALLGLAAAWLRRAGPESAQPATASPPASKERLFQSLVENSLDVIVMLDAHGTIRYVNRAIEPVLGYHPERLGGASVFPSIHPEDVDRVHAFFLDRREVPGAAPTVEFRFLHRDGAWRYLEAAASNLLDDPTVGAIVVAARDVTTRRHTERELERLAHRLELVMDNAPVVLFALAPDGTFTLSEGRGLGSLGLVSGEVVGRTVWEVYAEFPAVLATIRKGLAGAEVREILRVGERVFETWLTPVFAPDAQVASVVGVATDITDRERAWEALQHSEESYRALVEHATYGMYRSTAEGTFVSVNPALVRMLGYDSADELIGADLAQAVYNHPATRGVLVDRYADAEQVSGLEIEWRRKDGSPILVRLGGRPIRAPDGSIQHYEMIVEDVTERRALEGQLRQAQKMEAVGQLTGGIAHDFNNLLTVILANADVLEADLPADRPELRADIEELRRAARRGSDMVRKLLGYSRRGVLALAPVDLNKLLAELLPTLRRLLPETIEVRFEPLTREAGIVADTGAVEQILLNLATNARDAMPVGGTLTITVGHLAMGDAPLPIEEWGARGNYVRIAVRDSGCGMDEETRARIFDPFFTTKRVGQGTGLGMAMVYGLVKQQGGFIDVRSAVEAGTTVELYFPATPSLDDVEARAAPVAEPSGGTETILLVEDEAALRRSAARVLQTHGYRVLEAQDGAEALGTLAVAAPSVDLVISDVVMPKMGGVELYQRARAAGHEVRFLFTSGYAQHQASGDRVVDPGVPFLAKPWELQDLLAHVRHALDA